MCSCEDPLVPPSQGIGSIPPSRISGQWALMEDPSTERPLRNCECGCNAYSPLPTPIGIPSPYSEALRDIPALPLTVTYEDDDGPSDDHEYVTIKATEFADMLSDLRACTCQTY